MKHNKTAIRFSFLFSFLHTFTFELLVKPWTQVSSLLLPGSCLQFLSRIGFSNPTARRLFIEGPVLLTHALALSACQFVHKKKSQRIYTSKHSAGLELTKLTYTRLEDNLIRHRGDRCTTLDYTRTGYVRVVHVFFYFCFYILRRMGKNAHHTSTYFRTRLVSI